MSSVMTYSVSSDGQQHPSVSRVSTAYTSGYVVTIISGSTIHLFLIYCSCFFDTFKLSKPDSLTLA